MNRIFKILIFLIFSLFLNASANPLYNIREGILLYNGGDYQKALDYFNNYTLNNPNDEYGFYYLGKIYKITQKEQQALQYFKKAYELTFEKRNIEKIQFDPSQKANLNDYFDIASTYFETGNYDKADKYAQMMLKIDPRCAMGYFILAKTAYTRGEEDTAREFLNHAIMYNNEIIKTNLSVALGIKKVPNATKDVYFYKAMEHYFKGDLKFTKSCLEKYIELDLNNIPIRNFLFDIAYQLEDYDFAQKMTSQVSKISPDNIQNNINLSKIYILNKQENKALDVLLKSYKLNPNNKELLFNLGNYYFNKENYKTAKKYYEDLITTDDSFIEAYYNEIYCLIRLKDYKNAVSQIRKLSAINPQTSQTSYLLAQIAISSAQYKEGIDYLTNAISIEKNPHYYFELANLYYTLAQYNLSLTNLCEITKSGYAFQNIQDIYTLMALNYLKLKDINNTLNIVNSKNQLDRERIIYKYILYKLYKLKGNFKESQTYYSALKKTKLETPDDYLDISEVYFEESNTYTALKTIEEGIKKYPNSSKLQYQKTKFDYLINSKKRKS